MAVSTTTTDFREGRPAHMHLRRWALLAAGGAVAAAAVIVPIRIATSDRGASDSADTTVVEGQSATAADLALVEEWEQRLEVSGVVTSGTAAQPATPSDLALAEEWAQRMSTRPATAADIALVQEWERRLESMGTGG